MRESHACAFIAFQNSRMPAPLLLATSVIAILLVSCSAATPVPLPTVALPTPTSIQIPATTPSIKNHNAVSSPAPLSLGCAAFDDELSEVIAEISLLSVTTIPAISVLADEGTDMTRGEYESGLSEVADTLGKTATLSGEIALRPAPTETLEGLLDDFAYWHGRFVEATLRVLENQNGSESDQRLAQIERNVASTYYLNASRELLEESARCRDSEEAVW